MRAPMPLCFHRDPAAKLPLVRSCPPGPHDARHLSSVLRRTPGRRPGTVPTLFCFPLCPAHPPRAVPLLSEHPASAACRSAPAPGVSWRCPGPFQPAPPGGPRAPALAFSIFYGTGHCTSLETEHPPPPPDAFSPGHFSETAWLAQRMWPLPLRGLPDSGWNGAVVAGPCSLTGPRGGLAQGWQGPVRSRNAMLLSFLLVCGSLPRISRGHTLIQPLRLRLPCGSPCTVQGSGPSRPNGPRAPRRTAQP